MGSLCHFNEIEAYRFIIATGPQISIDEILNKIKKLFGGAALEKGYRFSA